MHEPITARREIAVTGDLIAIRRQLVLIGGRPVVVRSSLIGVGQGLIAILKRLVEIGERLLILKRTRLDSTRLSLHYAVRRIPGLAGSV